MEVAVWDTYVQKKDGRTMHFDILVPSSVKDASLIFGYGKSYLDRKGQEGRKLSSKECSYCHIEKASAEIEEAINSKGYYIIEMEGCE
jgi:hypothetical protein